MFIISSVNVYYNLFSPSPLRFFLRTKKPAQRPVFFFCAYVPSLPPILIDIEMAVACEVAVVGEVEFEAIFLIGGCLGRGELVV